MGFNINNQTGGVVNNVEGNQYIRGDQHGQMLQFGDARKAVQELETGSRLLGLKEADYSSMSTHLKEIKAEISRINPEPEKVARPLEKIAEIASAAGALAGLAGPIQNLITWLGPLGQPIAKVFTGM